MGYALLAGNELLYHGVKVFTNRQSPHENLKEGGKAILSLINHLKPTVMAVEKTFLGKNRKAALLNVFADEIVAIGKRKGLQVVRYAPSTIKKFICGHGWADKLAVANMVVFKYPQLRAYLVYDRKWKALHHANMFDAVALGLLALEEI